MVVGNCVFRVALCKVFGGGGLLWGVYWYCRPPACGVWVRALPPACVGAEVGVENPGTMLLASWALWDALVQRMLRAQDLVAPEAGPFRLPRPLLLVSGGSPRHTAVRQGSPRGLLLGPGRIGQKHSWAAVCVVGYVVAKMVAAVPGLVCLGEGAGLASRLHGAGTD